MNCKMRGDPTSTGESFGVGRCQGVFVAGCRVVTVLCGAPQHNEHSNIYNSRSSLNISIKDCVRRMRCLSWKMLISRSSEIGRMDRSSRLRPDVHPNKAASKRPIYQSWTAMPAGRV